MGAYGNTWFETDNFNRLAARSLLFEQAISPSATLESAYQQLWGPDDQCEFFQTLGQSGISSTLITDESVVEDLESAAAFDRVIPIRHPDQPRLADRVEQTELASFFAQTTQWLMGMEHGTLGWLHSRGLSGAWDAPYERRQRLADSEDPDPPRFCTPPSSRYVAGVDDPDELLGYQQACAAQVILIDDFLGAILELMETDPIWQSTLFCVMSTRGYPLGEHQRVGEPVASSESSELLDLDHPESGFDTQLYNESIHVPLMMCLPNRPEFKQTRAVRNASLVRPSCLSEFLINWLTGSAEAIEKRWQSIAYSMPEPRREVVCTIAGQAQTIQTHAWKLVRRGAHVELYVKPDDRCEVNDVSRRCPHVVAQLIGLLDQWIVDGKVNQPREFELAEELAIRSY